MMKIICDRCNNEAGLPYCDLMLSGYRKESGRKSIDPVHETITLCGACLEEFFVWVGEVQDEG